MKEEISIHRFGDPFFSELPLFIWGPVGCGKVSTVINVLCNKNSHYHVMCGYNYKHINHVMNGIEMWLENNYTLILDEFDISENSIEKILSKQHARIILMAHISIEENIPNHIKANFNVIHYSEIKEALN